MPNSNLRNVAIVAHVDHGKTTLVDQLFRQSGLFRDNQVVEERLMDSMDLEKERGITIMSKNGRCTYKDTDINIIDTPGHADFGGEVERVLGMADGAVFLVDAQEGPMPQSYFVLKKAVARNLPIIVVVNKIDKANARCDWVVDQVFDLLVTLEAPDELLDFPIVYASSRNGIGKLNLDDPDGNLDCLFDTIVSHVPCPKGDENDPVQFLVSSVSYSPFLGRLAIGTLSAGSLLPNQNVVVCSGLEDENPVAGRITKIYKFKANEQIEADSATAGDIIALAGVEDIRVGQTITDPQNPQPLPMTEIDPPTIAMTFIANDSPFAGTEGEFVTSRHLKDRLERELLSDAALQVEEPEDGFGFKVSGRGELHLSILIEKMRREGYEFQVSKPTVIFKEIDGSRTEPYEELNVEVDESNMGPVMESLGARKGQMVNMETENGLAKLVYEIPTRGILGYLSEFMTQTKGLGILNSRFSKYGPYQGPLKTRKSGVLISNERCTTVTYALENLQNRGVLFMGPGIDVYEGQIIGENSREDDMVVNPAKSKKLTNVRASGSDDSLVLTPPKDMSLEAYLAFIETDELVEVTPQSIRVRKKILKESDRKRSR